MLLNPRSGDRKPAPIHPSRRRRDCNLWSPLSPLCWGEGCCGGGGAAETRAGEALLQNWLYPRSGGQRGGFPGALARGRPHAGPCSQNPNPEAPGAWAAAHSLAPFPIPTPSPPPPLFPGLWRGCITTLEAGRWGRGRDSWDSFFSLLGWMEVAQMGQEVVGLWAAEASSLVAHGEVGRKGGKRRQGLWGAHFIETAWMALQEDPEPPCPGAPDLRPWALLWMAF